ncbi:MAG: type II toxin-antitoxin system Phd/YefM family antitoxin [bacterium]
MLVNQISVDEIKRDFSKFLKRVESGEILLIMKAGKPLAETKPVSQDTSKLRPFGLCEGDFTVPDDFDVPLPEDIIKGFEGQ